MLEHDLTTALNVLRKVSHRPRAEQETILREWFGKRANAAFIAEAMKRFAEGSANA